MRLNILDIPIDCVEKKDVFALIDNAIKADQKIQIATVNNEFIVDAQKNIEFKNILNKTSLNVCDSTGITLAAKFLSNKKVYRLPGADLFDDICSLAQKNKYKIYLLGGKTKTSLVAASKLSAKYKNLQIVGTMDGVLIDPNIRDENLNRKINESNANIVFVALGAPKQEIWIKNNMESLEADVFIGIGGTLDYVSGRVKRAPKFLRAIGLEWLVRLIIQPSRFARIYKAIFVFPVLIFKAKYTTKRP